MEKEKKRQSARGTEIKRMSPTTHIADLRSLKIVSASTVIKKFSKFFSPLYLLCKMTLALTFENF